LRAFITAAEQNHKCLTSLAKINAVTWSVIYAQFKNPFAKTFEVAQVALSCPRHARKDTSNRVFVFQFV
jgi:hypothetical protein